MARGCGLNTHVEGDDGVLLLPYGFNRVRLVGRNLRGEIGAFHRVLGLNFLEQLLYWALSIFAGEQAGGDGAVVAQVANQGAGIDAANANDPLLYHLFAQAALCAPVGYALCKVADNEASNPDAVSVGLVVLIIPTGIANVRRGGYHDLAVVGRVRHGFLVAGHRRGEYGLAQGGAGGAKAITTEGAPVRENEDCWGSISHVVAFLCHIGGFSVQG